jgi:hypothetical protein
MRDSVYSHRDEVPGNGLLVEVRLYPGGGTPMMPSPEMAKRVLEKVQRLAQPFGTKIVIENAVGVIRVPHQESEASGVTGSQAR